MAESANQENTLVGAPWAVKGILQRGFSMLDVRSLARHSSLQMTQRYIGVSADAMKKVVGEV